MLLSGSKLLFDGISAQGDFADLDVAGQIGVLIVFIGSNADEIIKLHISEIVQGGNAKAATVNYFKSLLPALKNISLPFKILGAATKVPFFFDIFAAPSRVQYDVSSTAGVLQPITAPANTAPTASFSFTPASGTTSTDFQFDASGCSDSQDAASALQVRWDFENNGTWTSYTTSKTATHRYSTTGTKTVKLEVKDSGGLTGTTTQQVTISGGGGGETGTVTDIDGNVYRTVKIGNQWWMAENLKVTRYRNGEAIPNVEDAGEWPNLATGAYCNYDNDVAKVAIYGRLYNWFSLSDSRSIAPAGWHVSTDEEWKQLEMTLGMSRSTADDTGWRGSDEGGKMKATGTREAGTGLWYSPNEGATNASGFSALPCGIRNGYGAYHYLDNYATFWSFTESISNYALTRSLYYNRSDVNRSDGGKVYGFSVRCVRD